MMKSLNVGVLILAGSALLAGCGATHPVASNPSPIQSPATTLATPSSTPSTSTASQTSPTASISESNTAAGSSTPWQLGPMNFISPSTGWVAVKNITPSGKWVAEALFVTKNGGHNWTRLVEWNQQSPMPIPSNSAIGSRIPPISQLNFQNSKVGTAVISLGAGACQAGYGVLTTNDGGSHWVLQTHSVLMGQDGPLGLVSLTAGTSWLANGSCAGAYTTLYKSSDGGQRWSQTASLKTTNLSPSAISFRFTTPTQGYVVNGANGYQAVPPTLTLDTTNDGGQQWTASSITAKGLPSIITGLSFVSPEEGWAVANALNHSAHVYRLHDGTWSALNTPDASSQPPTLDLVNNKVAYLNQPQGAVDVLWKTVDGGAHWSRVPFPTNS